MIKRVLELDTDIVKGNWGESTDPMVAYLELLEKGYNPEDSYVVLGKETDVVHKGNLLECLTEASRLSSEGYFVVMPAEDRSKLQRLGVH